MNGRTAVCWQLAQPRKVRQPVRVLMLNLRVKDWVRFGVVGLLVVTVLAVEFASGGVREFYAERPLQAGVLTGPCSASLRTSASTLSALNSTSDAGRPCHAWR